MKFLLISLYLACNFSVYKSLSFKSKSIYPIINNQYINSKGFQYYSLSSTASVDLDNVESTSNDFENLNKIQKGLKILYKFCRPHTIKGTLEILISATKRDISNAVLNILFCCNCKGRFLHHR